MADKTVVIESSYSADTDGPVRGARSADTLVDGDGNPVKVAGISPFGEMYMDSYGATTITTALTYVKVAGTFAPGELVDFDEDTNGRLTYNGSATLKFLVIACLSARVDIVDVYHFRIAKNGTTQAKSEQHRDIQIEDQVVCVTAMAVLELATDDYIEIFVTSAIEDAVELNAEYCSVVVTLA